MTNKGKFTPLIISLGVGLGLMGVVFLLFYLLDSNISFENAKSIITLLADSSFCSGVLMMGVGGITCVNRQGTFDGIGFAFESILVVRNWSPKRRFSERETFDQYRDRKAEKRKEKKGVSHLFISGGFYLLLSIIFLIIYSVM